MECRIYQEPCDDITNPERYNYPLDITGYELDKLTDLLASMVRIREAEYKIAKGKKEGVIGGPVHLGVGQEAVAAGISSHLGDRDYVFGAHRSHAHILSLGADTRKLFAEILGKATGLSKGMGGSMHLWDKKHHFYGSVPIVAGTVALAAGSALSIKFQKSGGVAVAYLGDGATEEGVVHETMNFSKITGIPVVFVVENNLFSSHMHIKLRQPSPSTTRFALANHIPTWLVDGNNVLQVTQASDEAIAYAREHSMPVFMEMITYRWYGHVDWREDIDVGVFRSQKELNDWKRSDPISRLCQALFAKDLYDKEAYDQLCRNIREQIENDWINAINDPDPDVNTYEDYTYYQQS